MLGLTVFRSFAAAVLLGAALPAQAAPKVIASIVPVHALVAGVMEGVGEPELLLSGQGSEHQASYSPQQIQALGEADLVFIIGHGLELKLDELSGSEAVKGRTFRKLADVKGLTRLPIREGGAFEGHEQHAGEEGELEHGTTGFDPHLWLDPANARLMVAAIAADLVKADPANAGHYEANAADLGRNIDGLSVELAAALASVKNKPFIVFHDAYQYFENRFGLAAVGSISDFSANAPSAQRLKLVRDKVRSTGATCVFREPQFSEKAARVVVEDTGARDGVLDPVGSTLTPGKGAYRELLLGLAHNLKSCLAG